MGDLVLALGVLTLAALGLFLLTVRWTRCWSPRACDLAGLAVVVLLLVYIRTLWYDLRLAHWLPLASLVVLGNWLPLFAAVLAGLVWNRTSDRPLRRRIAVLELTAAGILAAIYPLLGASPACGERWDRLNTCLQTTPYTCSPAAAATLLRRHGIAASEQEMARLCLTRKGTSWQGLYRGLKLKTAGTPWDVEVCRLPAAELLASRSGPMILSVGLGRSAAADGAYTREFGWVPGVSHSVVLESVSETGCAVIADPSCEMCREYWDRRMLAALWRGYGLRLVPRR
ncbi:MAG TPA: peptidase C39 [Pirellulaceae bacterium]|nr:peptidase C39 [Pirellulaceae bacterium]